MTNAAEPDPPSQKASHGGRFRHLDTIAAVLIAAVGVGLAWYARGYFVHPAAGPCPAGYCGLFESIGWLVLIMAALALVLAAAVGAHRRRARLIGLGVCGFGGGGLLYELLREFAAPTDPRGIEPDPQLFAIRSAIAGVAVALSVAAVLLFLSLKAERVPDPRARR
jgi:hypothetical protein